VQVVEAEVVEQWGVIARAVTGAQRRALDDVERSGLPGQWFTALHLLLISPEQRMPMSHIARDLGMTAGGFTKLADRLGREGFIDRRNASSDRRVIYAVLTERGIEVAKRASALYETAIREHIVDVLTPEGLARVAEALGALGHAHRTEPDSGLDQAESPEPGSPERRHRGRAE
jgi:DNA-binding MarR family transcriptional regulator